MREWDLIFHTNSTLKADVIPTFGVDPVLAESGLNSIYQAKTSQSFFKEELDFGNPALSEPQFCT